MNKYLITLVCTFFLFTCPKYSFSMNDKELAAQNLYWEAVYKGGIKRVEKAEKEYSALLKTGKHPINYKLRIASLTAMKAKYVFWPHEKMAYVNESMQTFNRLQRKIDKKDSMALTYEFHMYRGRTYIHFPFFFNKKELAMEDIKKAAEMAVTLKRPTKELGPFYLEYAEYLKKDNLREDAKTYAKKALQNQLSKEESNRAKRLLK